MGCKPSRGYTSLTDSAQGGESGDNSSNGIIQPSYWPFDKTLVKMISIEEEQKRRPCNRWRCCAYLFVTITHILFIIVGVFSQLATCFSRQNPYAHWVRDANGTIADDDNATGIQYCHLECEFNKNFITGLLFPDLIIVLLSLWVYIEVALNRRYLTCEKFENWRENLRAYLNFEADLKMFNKDLTIQKSKPMYIYGCSIGYIFISLLFGIIYLLAFEIITRKDLVIHSITSNIGRAERLVLIFISMIPGFIAFDLLYILVVMRYAYFCDFVMNYLDFAFRQEQLQSPGGQEQSGQKQLQSPGRQEQSGQKLNKQEKQGENEQEEDEQGKNKLGENKQEKNEQGENEQGKNEQGESEQGQRGQEHTDLTSMQKKNVETAFKIIRWLNKSSITNATEIVIVIAGFTAISCIINLLNTTDCPVYSESSNQEDHSKINKKQTGQVAAIAFRMILWILLVLFPFYKAAKVNENFCQLIYSFQEHMHTRAFAKYSKDISSEARLIGISVRPGIIKVVVYLLIFSIMLGSNIKWHFNLL